MSSFVSKMLDASGLEFVARKLNQPQLVFLCIAIFIFLIILFVKLNFKAYLKSLFLNTFSRGTYSLLAEKNDRSEFTASILVNVASILSIAASITSVIVYSHVETNNLDLVDTIKIMFACTGAVSLGFFLIYVNLLGLGSVLNIREITRNYYFLKSDIYKVLALIFFPLFLLMSIWGDVAFNLLFICMLGLFLLSVLFRAYLFFYYSFKIKFLNCYSIMYFCALEIIPILFLFHFVGKI